MDRGSHLLQELKSKLQAWSSYIQRSTHATAVLFEPLERGEFRVVVRWLNKNREPGEHTKDFTRPFVFGATFTLTPLAWAVEKKACEHARDIVQEILRERGVL